MASSTTNNNIGPVLDFEPTQPRSDGRPHLTCDNVIEADINEHVEEAHEHALEWALQIGLVRKDTKKFKKFAAARFTWLAARAYPTVGLEELKLISDWIAFLFFYDDLCDTTESVEDGNIHQLAAAEDRLIAIVANHGHNNQESPNDGPIHHSLISICDRAAMMGGGIWLKRLAFHLEEYIQGCRWERVLRLQGKTPSIASYSKLRLIISAVHPCFDFAGLCIDPSKTDFAENPLVQKLEMMANNHICWVNDVYGVDKEIKEETTSNIVVVIAHENGLPWKEALDRSIIMCNKEAEAFVELEECILTLGTVDDNTKAYIHALKTWMRGNFDWYSETGRYKAAQKAKGNDGGGRRRASSFVRQSWRIMGDQLEELRALDALAKQ
ncbi:Terpene synthase family, metal binding domain [Seminavis robusta]|uniref:Terpene synthase n=1 Tax=Seminavis robusta TaxID=568900 RepID=A0A9N8DTE1_9STRA|nr:Terpene synthase family, metal binding domain [Seminavis robusta]|eukprot:Sro274_g105570.1 Terpene synthase family, metal binding domain (383) ;mRNA; r:70935-72083